MDTNTKIDIIYKGVQDLKLELARHIVYQEQLRKEMDEHKKEIEELKKNQNKAIGFVSLVGLGVSAAFTWLFKHI